LNISGESQGLMHRKLGSRRYVSNYSITSRQDILSVHPFTFVCYLDNSDIKASLHYQFLIFHYTRYVVNLFTMRAEDIHIYLYILREAKPCDRNSGQRTNHKQSSKVSDQEYVEFFCSLILLEELYMSHTGSI
jgi:hypothetical protein